MLKLLIQHKTNTTPAVGHHDERSNKYNLLLMEKLKTLTKIWEDGGEDKHRLNLACHLLLWDLGGLT